MIDMGQKQPYEEFYFRFWFTDVLSSGDSLSSLSSLAATNFDTGADATSVVLDATKTVVGANSIDIWIKGGVADTVYKYTLRAHTANADKIEADGILAVVEL
jgi:hypothetical protein